MFIFDKTKIKIYSDSVEGKRLENLYRITRYPFVAILDPRTGENVHQFNSSKLDDQMMFCEKVTNFLCEHGDAPAADFQPPDEQHDNPPPPSSFSHPTKPTTMNGKASSSTMAASITHRSSSVVEINDDEDEEDNIKRPVRKEKANDVVKRLEKSSTASEDENVTPKKRARVVKSKLDTSSEKSSPISDNQQVNGISPTKDDEPKGFTLLHFFYLN